MAQRTFAEMLEVIKQHAQGLVSDVELLLALQCDDLQVKALLQMYDLPAKAMFKLSIDDWDEHLKNLSDKRKTFDTADLNKNEV
jgi:hypothetical protein